MEGQPILQPRSVCPTDSDKYMKLITVTRNGGELIPIIFFGLCFYRFIVCVLQPCAQPGAILCHLFCSSFSHKVSVKYPDGRDHLFYFCKTYKSSAAWPQSQNVVKVTHQSIIFKLLKSLPPFLKRLYLYIYLFYFIF